MKNTFSIVGKLEAVKDTEKFKGYTESVSEGAWKSHKLNFNMKNNTGSHLLSVYAGYKANESERVAYTMTKGDKTTGTKGEFIKVEWSKRNDKELLETVAEFKKYVIVLSENQRMEFIHEYDFLTALRKIMSSETYKDAKFRVNGSIEFKNYEGKVYQTLVPRRVYLVDAETEDSSEAVLDLFYTQDAITDCFEENQRVFLTDVYTRAYNNDLKAEESCKVEGLVADFSNIKEEIKNKFYNMFANMFKASEGEVRNVGLKLKMINGVTKVEITEEHLTDEQKELIELGFMSFEDIKRELGGSMNGSKVKEMQFTGLARGFSGGPIETDLTVEDLTNSKSLFEDENEEEDLFADMFA